MTREIVCLDVETTGINIKNNYIIQLALLKFETENFTITDSRNWYIKPKNSYTIDEEAFKLHGLNKDFIEENGVGLNSIYNDLIEFISDCDILTYNGNNFDIHFLYKDLHEYGLYIDYNRNFYDSYTIECNRNSKKLIDVYKKYTGKNFEDAHDALSDVKATVEVFKHQYNINSNDILKGDFKCYSPDNILKKNSNNEIVFSVGKYARQKVYDVCINDPLYIKWIIEQCSSVTRKTIIEEYYKVKPLK